MKTRYGHSAAIQAQLQSWLPEAWAEIHEDMDREVSP